MKFKFVLRLVSVIIFLLSPAAFSSDPNKPDKKYISELEIRVKNILQSDNVSQRVDVNYIFELADIYAGQGKKSKALDLYQAGLSVDSFRFDYQLKYADLLGKSGDAKQAIEKYKTVYAYTENEAIADSARNSLLLLKADCPKPKQKDSKFSIIVVPVGNINRVLVDELLAELNRATGIKYALESKQFPAGKIDRANSARYLSKLCEKIRSQSPQSNPPPDTDPNEQMEFIIESMHKEGVEQKKIDDFRNRLMDGFQTGQRDADRLITELKAKLGYIEKPGLMGFLAITEEDIYSGDNNFLFGWAQKRFGLISYHRFKASFNEQRDNRPRLLKRTVKQGISSTFFILGIPRCTTPMCVRAYPNSLDEQDTKGVELCDWCKEQLSKKLSN